MGLGHGMHFGMSYHLGTGTGRRSAIVAFVQLNSLIPGISTNLIANLHLFHPSYSKPSRLAYFICTYATSWIWALNLGGLDVHLQLLRS